MSNDSMQISKMSHYWIVFFSIWKVFTISMHLLILNFFGKCDRKAVNAICYDMGYHLLSVVNAKFEIHNPHNVKVIEGKPCIIMSNHASVYDIPLIFVTFPDQNVRMVAKKELFKVPVWGGAMRAAEFISIDRENIKQAVKDLAAARDKLRSGLVLWIAPEGTRSRTGEMGQLKKGGFKIAMQTGATIIPVRIIGSEKIAPPGSFSCSVGEKPQVYVAKPIDAAAYKDIAILMHDVEEAIIKN